MKLSVIFTTYNSPVWLEKVLWGYYCQDYKDFEVLIADDGSTPETVDVIKKMKQKTNLEIKHVWHEDRGFRKCEILNKAIIASESEYLIFSDGDCIPRKDFIQTHFENKRENYFLSGGAVRLPMSLSKLIKTEHILSQDAFNKEWSLKNELKQSFLKNIKLTKNKFLSQVMNKLSTTKATWNGGNASAWKKDILSVNGFDERMRYGSEDREFGERLINAGIKEKQIRYSAICIHLDHSRGYMNQKDLDNNAAIRNETKVQKKVWTDFGIIKSAS
ncbi:MAG TPA: glycosyltransferase family 2 protein [Hanamia sp.]|nr:glycosyltransferase family 2 protein [Hanamia sp.]